MDFMGFVSGGGGGGWLKYRDNKKMIDKVMGEVRESN